MFIDVVKKDIKNLHLGVYPPDGRVRVAAPASMNDEAIRLAVVSRLGWIRRRQTAFAEQDRQSERSMVSGESHYVSGHRYLLTVEEADEAPCVEIKNNRKLLLRIRPQTDRSGREAVLQEWHRARLREHIQEIAPQWEEVIGVEAPSYYIKRMKTKWGSCNIDASRIWINLELAKKSSNCVSYILVHELVHLHERHHSDRFRKLMDRFMPAWRVHRDELNQAPLAHENWSY